MNDFDRIDLIEAKARELHELICLAAAASETNALDRGLVGHNGLKGYVTDLLGDILPLEDEVFEEMERCGTLPREMEEAREADWRHENPMRMAI